MSITYLPDFLDIGSERSFKTSRPISRRYLPRMEFRTGSMPFSLKILLFALPDKQMARMIDPIGRIGLKGVDLIIFTLITIIQFANI